MSDRRRRESHGTGEPEHVSEASQHVVPERLTGERRTGDEEEKLELELGRTSSYELDRAQVDEHERPLGQHEHALGWFDRS